MAGSNNSNNQRTADFVREAATREISEVLQSLGTSPTGLTEAEAAARLEQYGPNEVGQRKTARSWLHRLWVAVRNPLVILLTDPGDHLLIATGATFRGRHGDAG